MTARPLPVRGRRFSYGPLDLDEAAGVVRCHYELDGRPLVEEVTVGPGHSWTPAAREAARLVHLLAGVSYYKASAPPVVDLADLVVRPGERDFLRTFYLDGLGEFSFRNGLDLGDLTVEGGIEEEAEPVGVGTDPTAALVPFGGGIDSIVTVEAVRRAFADVALFVVNRSGVPPFAAIEKAAAATGLPIVRASRDLDPWILDPGRDPVFNGHVPVTGVISAIGVLCAALSGRGRLVMSNEWSASRGNLESGGRVINHQWSKSTDFEDRFRAVLESALGPGTVDYFSYLRPFSELWVADRFASMKRYHPVFHSCNRAFHLDPARRLDHWCGHCDKCCFIDLILAPFMGREALAAIFDGREPLDQTDLLDQFEALVGVGDARKPFECVGDVDECRVAAALAAARPDRAGNEVLAALAAAAGPAGDAGRLLRPLGPHHIPDELASALV